ncbi:MAG TPA: hypothetical protein VGC71_01595 [Gaiellales bacterium]|jgi:hypothetical protein
MHDRRSPRTSRRRRALLVGLTPLMMRALEGPLGDSIDVSAVPFPGTAFDRAVTAVRPDLVVVDVTYLDERRVRPLLMERFRHLGSVLVFLSEGGGRWVDDLGHGWSGPADDVSPDALLGLLPQRALRLVGR